MTETINMTAGNFKVIILGGGNCGLALATGLKKAGIEYAIFERDNEDNFYNGPRDWGMLLHWGAEYLDKLLPEHLVARTKEIRCNPYLDEEAIAGKQVPFVNALTGDLLAGIPMGGVNRISRAKLRAFLTKGEELNLTFNKTVETISVEGDKVVVTFLDGTSERGDALVGCDGSHSKVREFLVGEEEAKLQPVDLTMFNFPLSGYTAEECELLQTLHPIFKIAAHPARHGNAILAALDITDQDPTTWKFQNYIGWWGPPYASDLQDPAARSEFYRSFVENFCEPFRTAAMKLPEGQKIPIYPGQQWAPTMPWDNQGGKVTLAGDAAHSMLPQRGQGLNNAIRDAAELVEAFKAVVAGERGLHEAIDTYEGEMKPRGATEVSLSHEQAVKARDQSTLKESPIFKLGWQASKAQTS